jgi:hypothetical protein
MSTKSSKSLKTVKFIYFKNLELSNHSDITGQLASMLVTDILNCYLCNKQKTRPNLLLIDLYLFYTQLYIEQTINLKVCSILVKRWSPLEAAMYMQGMRFAPGNNNWYFDKKRKARKNRARF